MKTGNGPLVSLTPGFSQVEKSTVNTSRFKRLAERTKNVETVSSSGCSRPFFLIRTFMKTIILIISLLLLLKAQAQTPVTSTNLPTVAEALKIASSLQFRMKESDADKYLVNHGLICDTNRTLAIYSQNLTNGYPTFSTSYPLKDNCCLDLYYWHADSPDTWTNTDKRWEQNSILTGAEIESNWTGGYPPHYYRGSWAEIQSNDLKNYTQINLTNSK